MPVITRAHASRMVVRSRQPRLIGVLRAEVNKKRIREVAFEYFRRPSFPVNEQPTEF